MKNYKNQIIIVIALFIVNPFSMMAQIPRSDTVQLAGKIELILKAGKERYYQSEKLYFEVEVKNLLNETIRIPHPGQELRIYAFDPNGKRVPRGYSIYREGYNTVVLIPQCSLFEVNAINPEVRGPNAALGTYTIYAKLGNVQSNTIYIDYVQLPLEEITVREEYHKVKTKFVSDVYSATQLRILIDKYPNTVFLYELYKKLIRHIQQINAPNYDYEKVLSTAKEFIDRRPDDVTALVILGDYKKELKKKLGLDKKTKLEERDRKLLNDHLLELKKAYTGKRVAKYIDNLILTGE